MSVASEFPPEVHIPARARRVRPESRHLVAVPAQVETFVAQPLRFQSLPNQLSAVAKGPAAWDRSAPSRLCDEELGASAPLRLTRRGVAVLVLATVVAAGLLLLVAHASLGLAPVGASKAPSVTAGSVVVQDGDTLWSIAQRVRPAADPREVVDQLRRVNHLNSVTLSPGQTLKVG